MQKKLTFKNYLGYGLCDVSGMLAFSALGAYLSVFCTDILKISTTAVFVIMLCARIWDGINDPMMGFIVQNRKPGKNGKYRPFILFGGIPLSVAGLLCLTNPGNLSNGAKVAWAAVTYICYGMLYTTVLVPYGSMASVMTHNEKERSNLSMFRSIGGGVGSLPATMIFPLTVFTAGVLDSKKLFSSMLVLSCIMVVLYILSYSWTKENYVSDSVSEGVSIKEVLHSLLSNKAFVIMSIVGCLHMAVNMFINSINVYLFKDYFGKPGLLTMVTVASYIPMIAMIPFANSLIKKFGKKYICIAGFGISSLACLVAYALRFSNPWLYIASCFFINSGMGFMTLEVWAMAADVIDCVALESGKQIEAVSYSVFTFMRKIGQALASTVTLFLGWFGYKSSLVGQGQSEETLKGIYTTSTLVPFIVFVILVILMIIYPLGKKEMASMHKKMEEGRQDERKQA